MLDERVALAREALGDLDGVEVLPFTGLLVDFAREQRRVPSLRVCAP